MLTPTGKIMQTVHSADGTPIAYDQAGHGPLLILVDGAMCTRKTGTKPQLAELLAARFTVLSYDRRGRGDSGDTAPYTVAREIEDIEALIDASGPALSITGGHCDDNLLPYEWHATEIGVADGVENVQHKVREIIKYGADVIKVCATGGVLSLGDNPQASQYTQEELRAIIADAHRLGRKVAAHAHGAQGILWATQAGVDSIEHGSYIDDAGIAAMKEHGTYLVPTLYLSDWFLENARQTGVPPSMLAKGKEVMPAARRNVAHAFASGVKVGFGTDAAVYPHGLNAHEFAVMVKLGLTPLQAIQAATVNDADLLGWSDKIGVVEPNHYADIIAVDGDPLQDVTTLERVKFVMKGGVVYKSE